MQNLGNTNQCEDMVLLSHIIELVWFRTTRDAAWKLLTEKWVNECPAWGKDMMVNLKSRLAFQTRLAAPNIHFPPVVANIVESLPSELELAKLWIEILYNDGKAIDKVIEQLNAQTEPDSHVARLLFDAHHSNRYRGSFGEAQEVGLARRQLLISSSPLLIFHELREASLSEQFGDIIRRDEVGSAKGRFHVLTLAMLCELSALRLWDFFAWQTAVKAQSEAYLEVSKWRETQPGMAAFGIHLAIQSLSYQAKEKDSLIRNAISRLEFAQEQVLSDLGDWLPMPYPRQKPYAYQCLGDLSDLIPPRHWDSLAKWTVGYLEEQRNGKHLGGSINPLEEWINILPFVDISSDIWELFLPDVLRIVRTPYSLQSAAYFFGSSGIFWVKFIG